MATFLTIGYGDEAGYQRTPESLRNAAHAHDAELARKGALIGRALTPTQVRNPENRGVQIRRGTFATAALPLAGFAVIEAADIDEAVAMVANTPCAIAHGVVEVWPLGLAPSDSVGNTTSRSLSK